MGFLNVLLAAAAAYIFGALWYSIMAKQWMADVGLTEESVDRKNPIPYIIAFVAVVFVAGMMRHMFASAGVDTIGKGITSGLGMGLFFATPWLATCYGFSQRPARLIFIDGTYTS